MTARACAFRWGRTMVAVVRVQHRPDAAGIIADIPPQLRNGDTFRMYYRYDENEQWSTSRATASSLRWMQRVGIFASTQPAGTRLRGHTALFD